MPRKYPEIAELAGRVVKIRDMQLEALTDPEKMTAVKALGANELIQAGVFISREEVKDALLVAGVVAVAAGIENTRMIGGAISPVGGDDITNIHGLSVITHNSEVARRYDLPFAEYFPVTALLLNLAQRDSLPLMTDPEANIRDRIIADIEALDILKLEKELTERPPFSLENWRYDQDVGKTKFWLNPADQINDNYGWFTLAELHQWLVGQGPVVKSP